MLCKVNSVRIKMMVEFKQLGLTLNREQLQAATRFNKCVEDGQEYDVSPE